MGNLQRDGNENLPPRSTSAAGSYLTVESFQTARDDGDGSTPPGPVPQIMVQLPSNNPSLANLAGESGSEAEEFFDGEEGPEGNGGEGRERGSTDSRGKKIPRAVPLNEGGQSHTKGRNQVANKGGDNLRTRDAHTYSSSTDSGSGSDNENGVHSNHTEIDKASVTIDLKARQTAVALKASSTNLTKSTADMSRMTAIEA